MASRDTRHPMARRRVVHRLDGEKDVVVLADIPYVPGAREHGRLDLYLPPRDGQDAPVPVVIFVNGFPGPGFLERMGCEARHMDASTSWARLAAASGMAAVTWGTLDPVEDLGRVLDFVRSTAGRYGLDAGRLGLWACSGNVPNALWAVIGTTPPLCCAACCYGFMLDVDGATGVAEASRQFGFVNPAAGRTVADFPGATRMLVVRAGRDDVPGVNASIDGFLTAAIRANLPVTLVNHAAGPHAFDILDDTAASRAVVRTVLEFLRVELR